MTSPPGHRALILGGGGATGRAWEIGILKGLHDEGIDLADADLIVGTSAGAILGSQLRLGRAIDDLYAAQLVPPNPATQPDPAAFDREYFQATSRLWQTAEVTPEQRVEVGRRALEAPRSVPEADAVQRAVTMVGSGGWPDRRLVITAVDVHDGTRRLIDHTQGVPLERAVAASTGLPGRNAPITIGERRYMDGGVAGTHIDAAAGYPVVVAITPGGGAAAEREVAALRAQGSQVVRIAPDADARAARGPDSADVSRAPASAEAGRRQAATIADELRAIWNAAAANG